MMRKGIRLAWLVSLGVAAVMVMAAIPVRADLSLEKSEEWKGRGDSVVYGVTAGDVEGDTTTEIVTVGSTYDGNPVATKAQLRIWNWNDGTDTLTRETDYQYAMNVNAVSSLFRGVAVGNVDNDAYTEIVTAGYWIDSSNYYHDHLAVWRWDGSTVTKEFEATQDIYSTMRSVAVLNIDDATDGIWEIAVVGERGYGTSDPKGILYVFNWTGTSGNLIDSEQWPGSGPTGHTIEVRGVFIENVYDTSTEEIITSGYYYDGQDKYGNVRVYAYSSQQLTLVGGDYLKQFTANKATEYSSVFAGNLYSGGGQQIAVCGSGLDSSNVKNAGVDVLEYKSRTGSFDRVAKKTWLDDDENECHSIYGKDITGNSTIELIAGGYATINGTDNG